VHITIDRVNAKRTPAQLSQSKGINSDQLHFTQPRYSGVWME